MQELVIGQKIKIKDKLELEFDSFYDVSCFCLDNKNLLVDEEYMIFYNKKSSPDKSIVFEQNENKQKFVLDLHALPTNIEKLSFVITADDKDIKSLSKLLSCKSEDFNFSIDPINLGSEKALMFCEIYKKENQWRFNAFAQGYNDGLGAVLKLYGSEEEKTVTSDVKNIVEVQTENKPISLTKISLTKNSSPAQISLAKDVAENNTIEVSTMWYDNGDGDEDNDDLDLRVGLLMPDGRMTLIHGDGDIGALNKKPYIEHGGDVRVVQGSVGMEKVKVNPNISNLLGGKVAIVFSIYSAVGNGVVSVASLRPKMEIKTKESIITCEFDTTIKNDPTVYTYVIGMIEVDGDKLTVKQLGMTSKPSSEETPWIMRDNQGEAYVQINGPHHFKGENISDHSVSISMGGPSIFGKKNKMHLRYTEHRDL